MVSLILGVLIKLGARYLSITLILRDTTFEKLDEEPFVHPNNAVERRTRCKWKELSEEEDLQKGYVGGYEQVYNPEACQISCLCYELFDLLFVKKTMTFLVVAT